MQKIKNKYIINFIVSFYKFTNFVEKFVDNFIDDTKNKIIKKKNEYIALIIDYKTRIELAWIEHQGSDLLKIYVFIFLILWVMFQSYYYGGMSHISYDDYLKIKHYFFALEQKNDQYFYAIQAQDEQIEKMADTMSKWRMDQLRYYFTAGTLLYIGTMAGLAIAGIITVIGAMSK